MGMAVHMSMWPPLRVSRGGLVAGACTMHMSIGMSMHVSMDMSMGMSIRMSMHIS